MSVLVIGGAGYIGSHTVRYLQEVGEKVVVVDNLSTGHRDAVKDCPFYKCDIRNIDELGEVFNNHPDIHSVIHFAANSLVSESMTNPAKYYANNVLGMVTLLDTMLAHDVKNIVFSSTAATYGISGKEVLDEGDDTNPINPYGETKLVMENMMKWYNQAYGMNFVALRYFNACGAHPSGEIGEAHNPESHLIPIALEVALGKRDKLHIYGKDYNTPDGTCIRDYVHVMDLAEAHYKSVLHLVNDGGSEIINLGNGIGYSVMDIVYSIEGITNLKVPYVVDSRREGDPAVLIASNKKAKMLLDWEPRLGINVMIYDAWNWHKKDKNLDK